MPNQTLMIPLASLILALVATARLSIAGDPAPTLGYTEFRANLPGGRHANIATMRAAVITLDGSPRRWIAEQLSSRPDFWTQFAGWSPDGRLAIIGQGWKSPENAHWEEEHKQFRHLSAGSLNDMHLVDLATGSITNLTAIDRVSHYNAGLFFWPNDPTHLGFTALIGTDSHPFRMDRDGKNKLDLTKNSREFAYGFSAAPDGQHIAYHKSYQVFIAKADGSSPSQIATGNPFNFAPQWSPDGHHLLFVSGEHYQCHPYVVKADGTRLRQLANRGTYRGVTEFLDVPDFHGGSSDIPTWSADGQSVFYTAQTGSHVDLFRISLQPGATPDCLSLASDSSTHYHPTPSHDGQWLAYGSKRNGIRQLYAMRLADKSEIQVTHVQPAHAALWPHWKPESN